MENIWHCTGKNTPTPYTSICSRCTPNYYLIRHALSAPMGVQIVLITIYHVIYVILDTIKEEMGAAIIVDMVVLNGKMSYSNICKTGFYFTSENNCKYCGNGCNYCSTTGECLECSRDKYITGGDICLLCSMHCEVCLGEFMS